MARNRQDQGDPRVIQQWIDEGRGTGHNGSYIPWVKNQDVASRGHRLRFKSHITGDREVHLLSSHEFDAFYIFEWSPRVVDIREQYPLLPLKSTLDIAKELGVDHPGIQVDGRPIVMSTDLLITVLTDQGKKHFAFTIKEFKELGSERVWQKFEIERRYHKIQGHEWGILTERDIPVDLVFNLKFLRLKRNLAVDGITEEVISYVEEFTRPLIIKGDEGLSTITSRCDRELGLSVSKSLSVVYHLIYNRKWCVDLTKRLEPSMPLTLLNQ